jgi:hypothetical protein
VARGSSQSGLFAPQTGVVTTGAYTGLDGNTYVDVKLDRSGLTVHARACYTAAHATTTSPVGYYAVGDTVSVQVLPNGSAFGAIVHGVLM